METLLDRSISIRNAVADVQETLAIAFCLVILVIFLFLRSATATIIPALAVPISLIAHLRGDVRLRLLDQQHDAAGADAVGRLRGRRRHRHAGEHRPPHRGRHAAVRGGAQGLARNRLHHRVDHLLADRGVHPGAADGRHRRPRVPRIRGDDRDRHRPVGLRLADADADAVRARAARPSRGRREEADVDPARVRARLPDSGSRATSGRSTGCWPTSRSC